MINKNIKTPPQMLTMLANSLLYFFNNEDIKMQIIAIIISFNTIFQPFLIIFAINKFQIAPLVLKTNHQPFQEQSLKQ